MGFKNKLFRYYFPEYLSSFTINRMPSSSGVVLMYHEVLPDVVNLPSWLIVRESDYIWQLDWLRKHFDVVNIDEAINRAGGNVVANRPFAVISFDDGYSGNLHTVSPIMESMGLPFIVYLATQAVVEGEPYWYDQIINLLSLPEDIYIDDSLGMNFSVLIPKRATCMFRWKQVQLLLCSLKRLPFPQRKEVVDGIMRKYSGVKAVTSMLTSPEVRRLSFSSCATIGSHTHGHELLDQLEVHEVEKTINIANEYIKRLAGYCPQHFAYPNGNYNNEVLRVLKRLDFKTAVTTLPGILTEKTDLLQIPRLSVGRFDTRYQFIAKLSNFL